MAVFTGYVDASADDWQRLPYDDTGTLIVAQQNNVLSPSVVTTAHCKIDTSSIPDAAIIQSFTFNWYDHSYTKSRRTTPDRLILVNDSDTGATYQVFYSSGVTQTPGWNSATTTASAALAKINKSGYTYFYFNTNDPGVSKYRIWSIRAWDYSGDTTNSCYVEVTYILGGRRYHVQVF